MFTKQRAIAFLLVMILAVPGLTFAARKGRLIGKILDPDNKPIAGVTVTATCPEIKDFREVVTTNEKGIFKLDFERRFVTYTLRFVKEGFATVQSEQNWELEGTARAEFRMFPGESTMDDSLIVSTSNQAIVAFNEGVQAYNAKDWAAAELKFLEALGYDSNLHQAWGALSKIHLKQEDYQRSAEAAEKAIELGSADETVFHARWEAYKGLGDEAKAAEALGAMQSAGVRTEEAQKLHNQAVKLSKAGKNEEAFAKFQEALEMDPNLMVSLVGVATTGTKIGRDAEAAAAAETILRADPGNEQALRIRYNACLKIGEEEPLFEALVGLAAVEPVVAVEGMVRLAFMSYDAQQMDKAKYRFTKVLDIDPNQAQPHYYLGLMKMNDGAVEEAKDHFASFVELAPDAPEAPIASELLKRLSGS
jgi:tetratricopeptide (TPR) repeat protein